MRSGLPGEDLDYNGKTGETFRAHLVATGTGVFVGEAFDSPRVRGSVRVGATAVCAPLECDCLDLGDIEVDFEPPRTCELTVSAQFSGNSRVGEGGPLERGEAVSSARVRATMQGAVTPPQSMVYELCKEQPCGQGTADGAGNLTLLVPVVGDGPTLKLDADLPLREGDVFHYYSGSVQVTGCARAEAKVTGNVTLLLDHAELHGLAGFVARLPGPAHRLRCELA
jgi:hypothetical protein